MRNRHLLPVVASVCVAVLALDPSRRIDDTERVPGDHPEERPHNCRFWGSIANAVPATIVLDHLVNLPSSLESLSVANPDGWSVAYVLHPDSAPIVHRGQEAAYLDSLFGVAVVEAADASPSVAISHVRNCSVGLCAIPNPHPFARQKNGGHWLMGHNGTIDIDILLDLIRPEFLAENPPYNGQNPTDWIDSELYFLYMLQTFEDSGWLIKPSLGHVIQTLREADPQSESALNFVLTDGRALWSYREGRTLYYVHDVSWQPYSTVASQYPTAEQGDWVELADGEIVTLTRDEPPVVENIEIYFDYLSADGRGPPHPSPRDLRLHVVPNPMSSTTVIRYILPEPAVVQARVFDVTGRVVRVLASGSIQDAGSTVIRWDGRDEAGRALGPGLYYCELATRAGSDVERLVVLR